MTNNINTTTSIKNRCMRLRSVPNGKIVKSDFELTEEPIPSIAADDENSGYHVIVKNTMASIDPTHRVWMNAKKDQYMDGVELGDIMRAITVGIITESRNIDWPVGTKVVGFGGICDYYVGIPEVTIVEKCACNTNNEISSTLELSYGGVIIGLTAWHGVNKILQPGSSGGGGGDSNNEVVVISGGAGAVGSIAGQLSKTKGVTVIGIAGGKEKCLFMTETLGYDFAIDYKSDEYTISDKLKEYAPDGITGYFDNVGGTVTEAVILNARNNMKMAICGSISEYDDEWQGIKNFNMIVMRRISIQGFICTDHLDELSDARKDLYQLKKEGRLIFREDIREGIENYTEVVNLLFTGGNKGKLLLKIND